MEDAPEKSPSKTMLYVSNLPFSYVDEDLAKLFEGFEVVSAYIARRRNNRSKGFGFVNLKNASEQTSALEKIDGATVEGRTLTVKVAHEDNRRDLKTGQLKEEFLAQREEENEEKKKKKKNKKKKKQEAEESSEEEEEEKVATETVLYVSNLPFEWESSNLEDLFSEFTVKTVRIARRKNGKSKGFGFVEVADKTQQTGAIEKLNNSLVGEGETDDEKRLIYVKASFTQLYPEGETPPTKRKKKKKKKKNKKTDNDNSNSDNKSKKKKNKPKRKKDDTPKELSDTVIYVSNLSTETDSAGLLEAFKPHGAKLARVATRRTGKSKRFGFVTLNSNEEQKKILESENTITIDDAEVTITQAFKEAQEQPDSETMIYVSNLPFTATNEDLEGLFSDFDVTNAYISLRAGGRSKGFGFVDFKTHEDQTKALEKNGITFQERDLVIQVAKVPPPKKEENNENDNAEEKE